MQRGPLLQPLRSTELVLSGPPRAHPSGCVQPFRLRRAQHRQAHRGSHCLSFVGLILFSLVPFHRRGKPTLWAGFPLGVFSEKASLLSHGEAPLRPASPSAFGLTPFPQSCHGFVLAPSSRQKPRQPRVSANLCCGVVHSRAEPDENPSSDTRKGFLWAQLFRSPATAFPRRRAPFDGGFGNFRRCCVVAVPAPLPGARYAWHPDFALRRFHPSALQRSAIPPRRGQFPSLGTFSSNLWNSVRKFSNPWNMGPPLRGPPINWGPVRYAPLVIHCSSNTLKQFQPLLFPDIYREIETS